ncbi:MAG: DCL family protein [Planctomycetota bacterium]
MLKKYSVGEVVDQADHDFLSALILRHPDYSNKVGCGISHFTRGEHPQYHTAGFILHRADGSATDFSTVTCINAKGPSIMAEFSEACRQAADPAVFARKSEMLDATEGIVACPETGDSLGREEYWLVQTAPSWGEIVDGFIETHAITPCKELLTESVDNQYAAEFVDPEMARAFAEYHAPLLNLVPKRIRRNQV